MNAPAVQVLGRAHNAALLELARACPVDAAMAFRFDRGDNHFAWPDAVFRSHEVRGIVLDGRVVAAGLVALAEGVTGRERALFAYGGDLRVHPDVRGRGFATAIVRDFMASPPREAEAGFVLVKDGNVAGRRMVDLGEGAGTLPGDDLGGVVALNLPLLRTHRGTGTSTVRTATADDVERMAAFHADVMARRPFAPVLDAARIHAMARDVPGLALDRWFIAEQHGRMVGMVTAWDQSPLRRTVVTRWSLVGELERAVHGLLARVLGGGARLPRAGEPLRTITLAHLAVPAELPRVLVDLAAAVLDAHVKGGHHLVTAGFHESDPLLPAMHAFTALPFRSRMFGLRMLGPGVPPLPPGMGVPAVEFARI